MKAIILAAGRGSRLASLTADRPKCMVALGGVPLIERHVETLRRAGADDIVIIGGYRADMLTLPGVRNEVNPDWDTTNMVATLLCAEGEFSDDLIVAYGDIVYQQSVLESLLAADHDIGVVVDRRWRDYWEKRFDDPLSDAESLRLDAEGCITDIGEPVSDIDDIQAQYIGLMRFRGAGVAALRETAASLDRFERPWMARRPIRQAYMTDLLMEMILRGTSVHAVPIDGGWLEIDTPEDHTLAEAILAGGEIQLADPSVHAE